MTAIQALLAFTGWTVLLVALVGTYRVSRAATGATLSAWCRSARTAIDPAVMRRIEDAHANCLENLPVFAVLVLVAAVINRLDAIAGLATLVVYARLAQSAVHIAGATQAFILVRATFWVIQVVLFIMIGLKLIA